MTAWLLLAVVAIGQNSPSTSPMNEAETSPTLREIHLIRREVSDLLKRESTADDAQRARLVRRMTDVYREVVGDPRFLSHPTLQQQKNKLWTRLTRVRNELKRRQAVAGRQSLDESTASERLVADQMATHLQIASQTLGGPIAVFTGVGGGGAVADDFGDELIDLIQNTIQPSHWNANGGPGSIFYYRPVHALVVRASSEVQGQVREVVGGLRDAGK
jgi:hypothetical protein